jgi:predicted phage-related endonuclease
MTELYHPKTVDEWLALRQRHVSSTESSALFGLNPYMTAYELAVIKKSDEVAEEYREDERQRWGKMLQRVIAQSIADDYGVKVRALTAYAVEPELRMGSSYDYEIVGKKEGFKPETDERTYLRTMYDQFGAGVLEIKNVDGLVFKNDWLADAESFEAPAHIELQVQHQLEVIRRKWSALGVLVGGNRRIVTRRLRDEDIGNSIRVKVDRFWKGLGEGRMPPLTMPEDARVVRDLYGYAETTQILDFQADKASAGEEVHELAKRHQLSTQALSDAKKAHETTGALLVMALGSAAKALFDDMTVNAGMVKETVVPEYVRKAYRNLRIYAKKQKGASSAEGE